MDRSLASDALLARGESSGVDGGGQLIDAVSDGVRPRRRKAQEQAIGCTTPDEVRPERGDFYPSRPRFLIDELFVDILEVRHRVQPCLYRSQLKRAGACPLDRVGQRFETLAIGRSHPAQVPRVVTVDDEVGKRHLFEKGRVKIRRTASGEKAVVQIGRDLASWLGSVGGLSLVGATMGNQLFAGALHSSLVGFLVGALFAPEAYQYFPYFAVAYTAVLVAIEQERMSIEFTSAGSGRPEILAENQGRGQRYQDYG
jgi:hypothetical protein